MSQPDFPTDAALLRLWGKTNRDEQKKNPKAPDKYHPLLFHLLDVALCARVLWQYGLSERVKRRFADTLHLSPVDAENLIVLLAGLHDLGKAYPNFQNKSDCFAAILQTRWSFDLTTGGNDAPHGTVSVPEIRRLFCSPDYVLHDASQPVARTLAILSGGHHGVFARADELLKLNTLALGGETWQTIRTVLAQRLADLLLGDQRLSLASCPDPADVPAPDIVPIVAGLIAVSDWFGSSFRFGARYLADRPEPVADYLRIAEQKAQEAVSASGWLRPVRPGAPLDAVNPMAELFAYLANGSFVPNAVQRKTQAWIQPRRNPYLLLIETQMGSGKTEAALFCADHAHSMGFANGFYIALPTMATSNAMYRRVCDFLHKRHPGATTNLLLTHSHAFLDKEYQERIAAGDHVADDIETAIYDDSDANSKTGMSKADMERKGEEGRVVARRWFAENKKQALLAQFGVGTIDQTLLGVLQTKHWFVRLFGLAGKVVCFDEIHAYDIYSSSLLCRLIQWLGEMGCTVVLLSATLSAKQRRSLLQAWCPKALPCLQTEAPYPRLTLANWQADALQQETVETEEAAKTVELEFASNSANGVLKQLRNALPDGGCAAVVCNTVTHAQSLFRELEPLLKEKGWECLLFHARTPFQWRKEREDEILGKFGKQAGTDEHPARPTKALVIATQTIEQSLDLDFDWMASEMAPVDLILQRMGRMHRHDITRYVRPGRPCAARFCILVDALTEDAIPDFGRGVQMDPGKSIYDRYIVLRSWLALHRLPPELPITLSLPGDIENLIRAVYDDDMPTGLPPDWQAVLEDSKQRFDTKREEDANAAKSVIISEPAKFLEFWQRSKFDNLGDEDDPRVHETRRAATRLGPPSITVICFGTLTPGDTELPLLPKRVPMPEDRNSARQLERDWMRFSLSIQTKGLYYALVEQGAEPDWKDSPLLKHARAIEFTDGETIIGNTTVRLSSQYGLEIISKDNKPTSE